MSKYLNLPCLFSQKCCTCKLMPHLFLHQIIIHFDVKNVVKDSTAMWHWKVIWTNTEVLNVNLYVSNLNVCNIYGLHLFTSYEICVISGIKPHICAKCNKGFYHVSNLQRHFRYCDPEKQEEKAKKVWTCRSLWPWSLIFRSYKHKYRNPKVQYSVLDDNHSENLLLYLHVNKDIPGLRWDNGNHPCYHCSKEQCAFWLGLNVRRYRRN